MTNKTLRVVSISGGKDSLACALIALQRFPRDEIRFVTADTGNEHELTMEYLTDYLPGALGLPIHTVRADFTRLIAGKAKFVTEKWPGMGISQDKIDRALSVLTPTGSPFLDLCIWKGRFPSRMAQFCTTELKSVPLNRYQLELIDEGYHVESWQGVRRDESRNRANAKRREVLTDDLSVYRPIVDWAAFQVINYVRSRGFKLNPLYSQGMGRVGCMPCINANKRELAEIDRRFPEHIERISEWESIVQEASKRGGATFIPSLGEGTPAELMAKGNITQVIKWAKTTRGGKNYDLLSSGEPEMCASEYGLCE